MKKWRCKKAVMCATQKNLLRRDQHSRQENQ